MKDNFSARLTALLIKVVFAVCIASLFIMPYAAKAYSETSSKIYGDNVTVPLLVTFYLCAAFGFCILILLGKLLKNIIAGDIFVEKNVKHMRYISWCCYAIAVITLFFVPFRMLILIVTFAAAFIGLILRVIKNCFTAAIAIREENDLTV